MEKQSQVTVELLIELLKKKNIYIFLGQLYKIPLNSAHKCFPQL